MNDVGGMEGFAALRVSESDPPFHADWEAHVHALTAALVRRGVFALDEFRDAIERMSPAEYLRHHRAPRYVRGHMGTVVAVHGRHVLPDDVVAHAAEPRVEPVYAVAFARASCASRGPCCASSGWSWRKRSRSD